MRYVHLKQNEGDKGEPFIVAVGQGGLPFAADDLLGNFDDERALTTLKLLAEFGRTTKVFLFMHHRDLLDLLRPGAASIHRLPRDLPA